MTNSDFAFCKASRMRTSTSTILCQLFRWLGFQERVRGSHHIFRKHGVQDRINLQRDSSKAKMYQVRQVRRVILTHGLEGES